MEYKDIKKKAAYSKAWSAHKNAKTEEERQAAEHTLENVSIHKKEK